MGDPQLSERNQALLRWYATEGRRLPWRGSTDPWWILVSEVMAQQTQLVRVVAAFERFLAAFPTPASLADADLACAIHAWGDLGYQRRVVFLRRAAAIIAAEGWPRTAEGLLRLPGIGPYTAAAVACFAFGERVAAPDANHRRVLSRWVGRSLGPELVAVAGLLLHRERPADWNQAVMDLGALLCRPRRPDCGRCPVARWCKDPCISPPRRKQAAYEGSVRQARASLLKALSVGALHERHLPERLGLAPETVRQAADALVDEGLVRRRRGMLEVSPQA